MKERKIPKDIIEVEADCEETALVLPRSSADADIVIRGDLDGLLARYDTIKRAAEQALKEGTDFGKIKGCGDKPTLLKPGAEKLATLFHLHPRQVVLREVEDWAGGFFFYRYKCKMYASDGTFVGEAVGSCNSKETKYRYRIASPICPICGAEDTIKRSKYPPLDDPDGEPGWYCYAKIGGCGANFAAKEPQIVDQDRGKVENTEPYELVNTIDKMAQKRAFVAAVLVATGASEFFTQDIEDIDNSGNGGRDVPAQRSRRPQPERADKPESSRPYAPEVLKAKMFAAITRYRKEGFIYPDGKLDDYRGAVWANLEICFAGDPASDDSRHLVAEFLVGDGSSKVWDDATTKALHRWMNAKKQGDGNWLPDPLSIQEAQAVAQAAVKAKGQQEMELE